MSELFQPLSHEETLQRIQQRLGQGVAPAVFIEELLPRSRDAALSWVSRLAVWEEYRQAYPTQVVALAQRDQTHREHSLTSPRSTGSTSPATTEKLLPISMK